MFTITIRAKTQWNPTYHAKQTIISIKINHHRNIKRM